MRMGLQRSASYFAAPDDAVNALIEVCHSIQQYRVYDDRRGEPQGFLSWAWLSDFTLNRLQINPFAQLHPSEWNEGEILCFRDLAATDQTVIAIAKDLRGGLFPDEPCYITMQTDAKGTHALIRFEPDERYELAEWLSGLYA
jgi:hemolysin-activating ACP:hemolysin acyltransferase